jgi:hypothetical protein
MRGPRLGLLARDGANAYLEELQKVYANVAHHPGTRCSQ